MVPGSSSPDAEPAAGALAAVLARHAPRLMTLPGVLGVGEGRRAGLPCVVVYVSKNAPAVPDIPARIEGNVVVIERVDTFVALSDP